MATVYRPRAKGGEDDFEILNPDARVPVGREVWILREYGLLESAYLRAVGVKAIESFDAGTPDLPALIAVIAEATGRDRLQVGALSEADFELLAHAWRVLNGPLFRAKPQTTGKKPALRWGVVYATLIAHGHDPARISAYTARQVELYFECAQRVEGRRRIARISDVNAAFAGGKHADTIMKKLSKET